MTAMVQPDATAKSLERARNERRGLVFGGIGVMIFGLTFPFTRMAVLEMEPLFVAIGRAVVAGALASIVLLLTRARFPERALWGALARYSLGVILGFPILSTLAVKVAPAAHAGVIIGILPLATAMASVVVAHERPSRGFWICGVAGSAAVVAYAIIHGSGRPGIAPTPWWADTLLFGAIICAAGGYAEGGKLAGRIGGWQAISWALVVSWPVTFALTYLLGGPIPWNASAKAWTGFLYVSVFSMFIGFFAWNIGLALGGIAKVGQVQLLQTFVTLAGAAILLGEPVGWLEVGFATLVVGLVALGWRTRVTRPA
jgi:drug/metabolite transporter (DMT)-like permease